MIAAYVEKRVFSHPRNIFAPSVVIKQSGNLCRDLKKKRGKKMKYVVPFGINIVSEKTGTTISGMPEEDYLAEAVRVVASSMKSGGFLGFGKEEKVNSVGMVYLSVYAASYEDRNIGLVFADDTLRRKRSVSFPSVFPDSSDAICRRIESASTADDYISRLKSTVELVKKVEKQKYDFNFVLTKKIIAELDNFLVPLQVMTSDDYVVSSQQTSNIDSEIETVLNFIRTGDAQLDELPSKISTIESSMIESSNDWVDSLEEARIKEDAHYVEIINAMVDRYNDVFLPQVEAEKDRKIAILSDRRDNAVERYNLAYERLQQYARSGDEGAVKQAEQTASQHKSQVEQIDREMNSVIENYKKEIKAEEWKIQSKRSERAKMNSGYESKEQKISDLTKKFQDKAGSYISDAKNELASTINEIRVSLGRFRNGLDASNKTQILMPVYAGVFEDKKKGKIRFVVVPPMRMEGGKMKVEKDGLGSKIIGKITKAAGAESFYVLLKESVEKRLDSDKNFQKQCLQCIQSSSIMNPSSEGFSKAKSGVQKLKKAGKIKDKEFGKIQTILKG